jgi:photosystem II stability/assembly factor-like uncharacterized protein
VTAKTGWAVATAGTIVKTTDGGSVWTAQASGTTKRLEAVLFQNGCLQDGGRGRHRVAQHG